MAGLYIHIPFCKSRCIYCGFYSTTAHDMQQRYVDAVCREMTLRRDFFRHAGVMLSTIYLGGGTPSQLTACQVGQLLLYINKVYPDALPPGGAEVTIECNPDDVTAAYAEALVRLGVTRVSMGAQTFDDRRLRFLHRRHTAAQVVQAVQRLRDAGIHNISVDLMYGFPGETADDWQRDIDAALALNVEHLSAYCLMVEEGTPLHRLLNGKAAPPSPHSALPPSLPDEEAERQMYELLIDRLKAAGYEHYEISNFARPGYRSRHNSSYWHDVPYIGLGAAAHSYDGQCRQWNVSDIRQYISAIGQGTVPCEQELLDADTRYNDRITVALRTSDGLDLTTLSERHRRYCLREARRYIDDGLLRLVDNRLVLTRRGLFVSDMVMSALMLV